MFSSLTGRFLILTIVFVMLAEVLIFLPSIARFREDYLLRHLERAQIASLALLADDMLDPKLEDELLRNAGVLNVVLHRNETRELILSTPVPEPISATYDIRVQSAFSLIRDAIYRLITPQDQIIRVMGSPPLNAGQLIETTLSTKPLRAAMIDYSQRVAVISVIISLITSALLILCVQVFLVKPIRGVINYMMRYAAAPEDAYRVIHPSASIRELREAEDALKSLQTTLTGALRQKGRLAQLGSAVSKISHDLRNILASAQLFTDRIESSEDPLVRSMAPKLVGSMSRAINLCENTLAFGKAEEPAPKLSRVLLTDLVDDVLESEQLAIGAYDLTLSHDIPAMMRVRADPEQLYRVLSNLIRNARQSIISSVNPGKISITAREDAENWYIYIADTGPGLSARAREHLFTAFQGSAGKDGTGLGLTISAELIRGHGGELSLEHSGPDGTTFAIRLPKLDGVNSFTVL